MTHEIRVVDTCSTPVSTGRTSLSSCTQVLLIRGGVTPSLPTSKGVVDVTSTMSSLKVRCVP